MNTESLVLQGLSALRATSPGARVSAYAEWGDRLERPFAPGLHLAPYAGPHFSPQCRGEFVGSGSHTDQQGAARGRAVARHNSARVRAGIGMTHQQPSRAGAQDSRA